MATTGTMGWYRNSPTGPLSMNTEPQHQNGMQQQQQQQPSNGNKFGNYGSDNPAVSSNDPFGVQYYQQQQSQRQMYAGGLPTMTNAGAPTGHQLYNDGPSATSSMGVSGLGPGNVGVGGVNGGMPASLESNPISSSASVLGNYLQAPSGSQSQTWPPPYFLQPESQSGYTTGPGYYVNAGYMAMDPNRYPASFQSLHQSYPVSTFAYPTVQHDAQPLPKKKSKSEQKTFTCYGYGACRMQFTRHEHLLRHIRKHTGERPYNCHCGKAFSRLDNLRQHANTVHQNPEDQNLNQRMMESYMKAASDASAANNRERERARGERVPTTMERSSSATSQQNRLGLNSPYSMDDESKQANQHQHQHQHQQQQHPMSQHHHPYHATGMPYTNGHEQGRKRNSTVVVYPDSLSSRKPSEGSHPKSMKGRRSWAAYDDAPFVP